MTGTRNLDISSYQYLLPGERIAKYPLPDRDRSRLLAYCGGGISHHQFFELPGLLPERSWVVFNNTRVIQARLGFSKPTGARIEVFCLEPFDPADYQQSFQATSACTWKCLVGNIRKWKEGPVFIRTPVAGKEVVLEARVVARTADDVLVRFSWNDDRLTFSEIVESTGNTPIPPYLKREAEAVDRERYQTIYGTQDGSVAAPTAGLHFTDRMMEGIAARGIPTDQLTLHVGAGTFVPVKEKNARDHHMHAENVVVERSFLETWLQRSSPAIAIGTTTTRSLESMYWLGVRLLRGEAIRPDRVSVDQWEYETLPGNISLKNSLEALLDFCSRRDLDRLHFSTRLMIIPGYSFRTIGGLVTNFHMPGSTLLLLIAAFVGGDWRRIYNAALAHDYRFLSYGDSSLLIPGQL
jgi:S-adenosylmethionine:tRNA ribosyltransferase-isomerase